MSDYRWNQHEAAAAYDAAAPVIHPRYTEVQRAILAAIPYSTSDSFRVLDLGGGSGRLMERILTAFPHASGIVLDQSEPFLALARQRLAALGDRAAFIQRRLQDDWPGHAKSIDLIVSTSAIHHLEPNEKRTLFEMCRTALRSGGTFINGDEHRPASDDEFMRLLSRWGAHMDAMLASGRIPASFGPVAASWRRRNLEDVGSPRVSGDDCQETVDAQLRYLHDAGFQAVEVVWHEELWAVTVAR